MRAPTRQTNKMLADGSLAATYDPQLHIVLPGPKPPVPAINLKPLLDAVARLKEAAKSAKPNDANVMLAERALLGPGLPRRPWYRNTIYAPGFYTGYGVKTLPGVREAMENRSWVEAELQAKLVAEALDRMTAILQKQ